MKWVNFEDLHFLPVICSQKSSTFAKVKEIFILCKCERQNQHFEELSTSTMLCVLKQQCIKHQIDMIGSLSREKQDEENLVSAGGIHRWSEVLIISCVQHSLV